MGKIKSSVEEEPNDSFTSMIDIVFLLLIFFLLQPFKEPEIRLEANLPKNTESAKNTDNTEIPKEDIKIRILPVPSDPNNARFVVDGRPVGMASLGAESRLAGMLVGRSHGDKEWPVAILPDRKVHFGHVLHALDACYRARMGNVKFGYGN